MEDKMNKLISLCKQRGFIFAGSEIYGGLANSWDFGPLGVQMKKNIKDFWWKKMVEERGDMVGMDGGIILNSKVLEAAGHVEGFVDFLVEDKETHKRYRADHLLEEILGEPILGMSMEDMNKLIKEKGIKSPEGNELTEVKKFNTMFQTHIGAIEGEGSVVYLRPETAQSIFVNFKNVAQTSRKKLPFGIAQIGKAFRNEITTGNFIFRTFEFEQMEIEYFIEEKDWQEVFEKWLTTMKNWAKEVGIDLERIHDLEVAKEDLAHYSKRTVDLEFDFPFGRKELWGLAYRTDFDLKRHQEASGQSLEYIDPADNKNQFIPHVVEPTFGVERTMLAILDSAYTEEEVDGETRVVMKFAKQIAPYQVAVLPLMKKEPLGGKAKEIFEKLLKNYRVEYDETGSIGKRYRRQDEIGTPFCITVDFDSVENGTLTVRDRDSMKQDIIKIEELESYLADKMKN